MLPVLIIDTLGLLLAAAGFMMAFRQAIVRRLLGQDMPETDAAGDEEEDALTYGLRIGGVMTMVFAIALAGMFTLFQLS